MPSSKFSQLCRQLSGIMLLVFVFQPAPAALASVTGFNSIWDPTVAANGFQLTAADPSGTASMALGSDNQVLTVQLGLTACYQGCGAFSLSHSGTLGNLPYGLVQFDWALTTDNFSEDGQINISGADSTVSNPGSWLYPNTTNEGSALIDYAGGSLSLFDVTFSGYDTGVATATVIMYNFSAPDAPSFAQGDTPAAVFEPAGWSLLLAAFAALRYLRRRTPLPTAA